MTENSFDFTTGPIPARLGGPGRPADPNPFLDQVAQLVDEDGNIRDVAVSFTLADTPDSVAADRVRRQLARAGIVHNVSVFKRIEDSADGSLVTFWAQNRIVPQRKPKDVESNGNGSSSEDSAPATESVSPASVTIEP